ncbi:chorismate mutase [Polymorphobacter arshaanensis]|uniref:chorismate mutase n=1 Tax=Glacieibacterium arshaanense TaxID=2511025 RepID=A0A4Y9ESS1_9SPHN|nr:chorismate mutase [Polymorphobacter arshaanensis]TFU06522.1 chorismate mutase [Polymorphobacter arshaanensis]
MSNFVKSPASVAAEACTSMTEVRAGVDAIDTALVALLAERMRFMDAAARIKPHRSAVRDEARKAQVITQAATQAAAAGLPAGLAEVLWEHLVEASIAYELARFEALHGGNSSSQVLQQG